MKTLATFHIGRGGRFYNGGYLSYKGEIPVSRYTDELFLDYPKRFWDDIQLLIENSDIPEDEQAEHLNVLTDLIRSEEFEKVEETYGYIAYPPREWFDEGGNPVGLYEEETEIGLIDLDGEYNTTYTQYAEDGFTVEQAQAIVHYGNWDFLPEIIRQEVIKALGYDPFDKSEEE